MHTNFRKGVRYVLLKCIVFNSDNENVIDGLKQIKNSLEVKNINIGIAESIVNETHFVKVFCSDDEFNDRVKQKFNLYLSIVFYKIIAVEFYNNNLIEFLKDNYFFLKDYEIRDIKNLCLDAFMCEGKIEDETKIYCINRKNSIIEKIEQCLQENEDINIKGLIRFRTNEMKSDFFSIVDKVIEKYMVEKEYTEFIKLLKYFVEIQECKMEEVNILIKENGEYLLQDDCGRDIMQQMMIEMSDPRYADIVNMDDVIISGLITLSPRRIVIHCSENCKNKELIETIKSVFEGRVSFCNCCEFCDIYNKNLIKT